MENSAFHVGILDYQPRRVKDIRLESFVLCFAVIRLPVEPMYHWVDTRRLTPRLSRSWYRARKQGWISLEMADEILCHLGLHPNDVYGAAWWAAAV